MVTLGLGMVMRGGSALAFRGVPGTIPLPLAGESLDVRGIAIPTAKLLASGVAVVVIRLRRGCVLFGSAWGRGGRRRACDARGHSCRFSGGPPAD